MTALPKKDTRTLVRSLREQGATLEKVTKGYRVLFPNGASTTIHWTNSDHRATMNMRAEIRRAGLVWPFDHQKGKKMGLHLTAERRAKLDETIQALREGSTTTVAEIARRADVSEPTARKSALRYGLVQEKRSVWRVPSEASEPVEVEATDYPEIERAKAMVPTLAPEPASEVTREREFIDSADSWVIPTPAKLATMAEQMGLNIEVRVWR